MSDKHSALRENWLNDIGHNSYIAVHRNCFWQATGRIERCELHGFSDASNKALCACVYAVYCENGSIYASLLTAKSRVVPVKKCTILRLELCAAELLVKLMNSVILALDKIIDIFEKHYWSDSMCTLYLIYSDKELKQFVANRVKKIRSLSSKALFTLHKLTRVRPGIN